MPNLAPSTDPAPVQTVDEALARVPQAYAARTVQGWRTARCAFQAWAEVQGLVPALGLTLAVASASPVGAQTVGDMIPACEAAADGRPGEGGLGLACLASVRGTATVMLGNCETRRMGSYTPAPALNAGALPRSSAGAQAWLNWARENPAEWGEDFYWSLPLVLAEAFPCEN